MVVMRLSDFQTGLLGPMDIPEGLPAYMGPHLLQVNKQQAVLRGGARQHARRFVLLSFIALPVFLVWGWTELRDFIRFMSSGIARLGVNAMPDGTLQSFFFDPTLAGFIQSRIHSAELILDMNASVLSKGFTLVASGPLSLVCFGIFLMAVVMIILRRTAAPIVVDRDRRVVYTREGDRIWAAPLDGIAVAMAQGPFGATSLAFGLRDIDAQEKLRWHPVAAYLSWSELFSRQRHAEGVVAENRWQAMRLWLAIFVAGYEQQHEAPAFGLTRLIAPRQARLGNDIDARIDQAIMNGKLHKGPFDKVRPAPIIAGMLARLKQLAGR